MKRICGLILTGIALLSLPLAAQEKNSSATGNANRRETLAGNTGESASPSRAVPLRPQNFLALPDTPRPTPFPAPPSGTDKPPGRLVPRYELSAGYSYVNFNPGGPFDSFDNHGGSGSLFFQFFPFFWVVVRILRV